MSKKLLLLAVLLAFGVVAFLAGLLAPQGWQERAQGLLAAVPGAAASAASAASAATVASAASTAGTGASAAAPAASAASAVPREQLWSGSAPLPGQRFGVLAGQFPAEDSARTLAGSLRQRGVRVEQLTVREIDNTLSWLVVIGPFDSEATAQAQAPVLSAELNLNAPLPVLALPMAAK